MIHPQKEIPHNYSVSIYRVFHLIDENLDADLSLTNISRVACFSPFHFHRIFKYVTGETLNEYVSRQRIEKAASTLLHNRTIRISELSLQNGFNNNSSFSRAFRKFYGMSPTEFRKQNPDKYSRIVPQESKNGQAYPAFENYLCTINKLKKWTKMNAKIDIRELSEFEVACIACIGPQNLQRTFEKLLEWATPEGLLEDPNAKLMTIFHDSFKITESGKVRLSACIVLNKAAGMNGEIGSGTVKAGRFIVGHYEIGLDDFENAWSGLYIWMNENGHKKADRNPFEIYHNNFNEHPGKKCIVDLYIPIE